MTNRSERQSFLGEDSDTILSALRVAIVGLGGGGSQVVQQLAHIGIGHFLIMDHDRIEESNLNRLVGGTAADVRRSEWKATIATRVIRRVNPRSKIIVERTRWQENAELLRSCDIIFGCIDSFSGRAELETVARRYLIPYIDIGMDVHEQGTRFSISGQVALSMPGYACLKCMNIIRPELLAEEARKYGASGGKPQVVWPNGVLASLAVGVMMQLVTPWHDAHKPVYLLEYDGNVPEVRPASSTGFLTGIDCPHFSRPGDLGDPWYGRSQ